MLIHISHHTDRGQMLPMDIMDMKDGYVMMTEFYLFGVSKRRECDGPEYHHLI